MYPSNYYNRLNQSCTKFIQIALESFHTLTIITYFTSIVTGDLETNLASKLYNISQYLL
jgi:hypothetical protein